MISALGSPSERTNTLTKSNRNIIGIAHRTAAESPHSVIIRIACCVRLIRNQRALYQAETVTALASIVNVAKGITLFRSTTTAVILLRAISRN